MKDRTTRTSVVLWILLALTTIGVVIDVIDGDPLKLATTIFLWLGLFAVIRWRSYRSRRWRTVAWICFVLAFAALVFRLGFWAGAME